jgi:hypothetical protein
MDLVQQKNSTKNRNEKSIQENLKLALKHLLHNTKKNRRIDFNEIKV